MDEFDSIEDEFGRHARLLAQDPQVRFQALRGCSFFEPVSDEWLRRLCETVRIGTFDSDQSITEQGEPMRAFHVILYGSAEAFRNGKLVGTIATGDCFGEGIFFSDGALVTSATVIADGKLITAEFSQAVVEALASDALSMASMNRALLRALFKKLQGANEKIERLMLR